jgi:hypothetical protein
MTSIKGPGNGFSGFEAGGVNTPSATGGADTTQPLDLNLDLDFGLQGNTFEVGRPTPGTLVPAGPTRTPSPEMTAAVDRFNGRLQSILGHDAMALAQGRTPITSSDQMTDGQRDQVVGAAKDMLMDIPISDLAPGLIRQVQGELNARGVDVGSLQGKSLSDLGELGGDLAKRFADNLREESPAVFYGLAGTAALAAGAHGYMNGSEALTKLGIKPEFKTGLFDDRLEVGASAEWGPKFSDPSLTLNLNSPLLRGSSGNLNLGGTINTDGDASLRLDGNFRAGDFTGSGNATINTDGDFTAGGSLRWNPSDELSAGLNANVDRHGDFRAGGSVRWKPRENVDAALTGSVGPDGDYRVGVGLKIDF